MANYINYPPVYTMVSFLKYIMILSILAEIYMNEFK